MTLDVKTAVILAGGLGTRLREAVPDLPKPMAPVRGRPFLEHQMDYWIAQGITRFVLSVSYLNEVIQRHFGSSYRGFSITYVVEKTPLGTGGGVLLCADVLDEQPFVLLNGDTFFEVSLKQLLEFHRQKESDWTFSLFRTGDTERYMGMDVSPNGEILSFNPIKDGCERLANGGVYLVNPKVLKGLPFHLDEPISLESEVLPLMAEKKARIYGVEQAGLFIDIGIPSDYRRAAEVLPS